MPKREPTPPPGDDEPYYFSVLNPWPPNANMELPGDMYRFVLWLAAAMDDTANRDTKYRDNHPLWAVFHKPSAPRLVIIEVSRRYPNVRRLLGQHFWGGPKGFLMAPPADENYSAIFYCHYTTGRQVEKNGWKRKWIASDMFLLPGEKKEENKKPGDTPGQPEDEKCEDTPSKAVPSEGDDTHSQTEDKEPGDTPEQPEDEKCDDTPSEAIPGKGDDTPSQPGDKKEDPKPLPQIFKKPYPATTYLLVPATDPTAVEFCRHLPLGLFPEAELNKTKPVIPPVGSATWAVKKDQRPLSNNQEKTGPPKAASTSSPITEAVCDAAAVEPKESEPQDLWADNEVKLISDFALASVSGDKAMDKLICPYHGTTCKKMCAWRTAKQKELGPKVGGPSNIKNYRGAQSKNQKGRLTIGQIRSDNPASPSSPDSGNMSPISPTPATTPVKGPANTKSPTRGRAPPPPPGLGRSIGIAPATEKVVPEAQAPDASAAVGIGRGTSNGPPRGAPVWASRGRGRGRA